MSFGVSDGVDFEYSGASPNGLFASRGHLVRPSFHRMVADLARFNREARDLLAARRIRRSASGSPSAALFGRLRGAPDRPPGLGGVVRGPGADVVFPARFLVEFFDNHGMLGFRGRPRWRTITGGSRRYVEALTRPWRERIRLSTPVTEVSRHPDHVVVSARGCEPECFDAVVIATHSDQALALLADPSERERELLGAIPYQRNEAVLHTDRSLLPRRRRAWASWNYHLDAAVAGRLHGDLPHEPPAVAARRPRVLRHAQSHRRDRPASRSSARSQYAHPVYTPARRRGAVTPRTRSADAIARTTAAPTGDGASTRTASTARCGSCARSAPGERSRWRYERQRDLRGHDPPPALCGAAHEFSHRVALVVPRPGGARRPARRPSRRRPVRALVRFRRADYLGDASVGLSDAVRMKVSADGHGCRAGPIRLLTQLRTFGHCFNPVSFYYCFTPAGAARGGRGGGDQHAVGRAPRLCPSANRRGAACSRADFEKKLHVSPFMGMEQRYLWRVAAPGSDTVGSHREPRARAARLRRDARAASLTAHAAPPGRRHRALPGRYASRAGADLRPCACAQAQGRARPPPSAGCRHDTRAASRRAASCWACWPIFARAS